MRLTVAGVPRSCQFVRPDGRWVTDEHLARIRAVSPDLEVFETTAAELAAGKLPPPSDLLLVEVRGSSLAAPGALEPYPFEIPPADFARLVTPNLRWLQSCSSGMGHILELNVLADDVALTNAAGVHADALAESGLAGILFHAKRLGTRIANQSRRSWDQLHATELRDRTVCIIGTGHIGRALARRCRALGMTAIGVRRTGAPEPAFDRVFAVAQLRDAVTTADYVVIACPLTPDTNGLITAAIFAAVRPGAYLINLSRGAIVDEAAMLQRLREGRLAGAYLDAHIEEPLPPDHPLWSMPNVLVIPHDSHASPFIGDNIIDLFCANLRRLIEGRPLVNVVDRSRGY